MRIHRAHRGVLWGLLLLAVAACGSGDEDDQNPECGPGGSCPANLICDVRTNRCVAASSIRDAQVLADAAAAVDARVVDAREVDASASDAPLVGVTDIVTGPVPRTTELTATFTFSGGGTYQCRLDGAAFATCTSPRTVTVAEGTHTFEVIATPVGGLPDPTPDSWGWTVDLTGPTVVLDGPAQGSTTGRDVSFSFTVEAGATVSCALDSTTLAACPGGSVSYTSLAGGAHVFRVQAADDLDNDGPLVTRTFTVDALGPTVTIVPFAGDLSDPAGTIEYSSEAGATFECALNLGGFATCPAAGLAFSGLTPGRNSVRVRATDGTGNTGGVTTYAWDVLGTANVVVAFGGVPQVGAAVISHRANGDVLTETKTGAGGAVGARVLPDCHLTAIIVITNPQTGAQTRFPISAMEVDPGDSVRLEFGLPTASVATLTVTGNAPRNGASDYWVAVGGAPLYPTADAQQPMGGVYNLIERSYDVDDRVSFLGQARARIGVFAFLPHASLAAPRGANTTLPVDAKEWLASEDWVLRIASLRPWSYLSIEPGVYRQGIAYPIAEQRASDISLDDLSDTFHLPPAASSFADGRWVRLRVHAPPTYKTIIATDTDAVDMNGALPGIIAPAVDISTPPRPLFTWTGESSLAAADGAVLAVSWRNGETTRLWYIITPSTDKVQLPAMPAAYADLLPNASSVYSATILVVDSTFVNGYTAFKRVHQQFTDASGSTLNPDVPQTPPTVPGRGTTRTTLRSLSFNPNPG